ncbi:etoposide-induced protein 2.4 (EI24) [Paraburkholderia eburnea]|uniref:Etoposide-induced protein 2.4 (EI24) n=1 Tax=Paraburkholderia eburnea TaxID=1189126 RepID=A0A2S4MGE4_9BURK|nr:EI24 domain-containing protein [Paraburkholderia eburnea]POR53833.1 etoposide-induced protein 2.4 (EI24) [Paraburkholderia eburnea]PRZ25801.1 etoposide-induced protein 2.4 (EI24) [Paraburkholderia eburnea]
MNDLLRSFGRALASAFHPSMLFLTFVPFLVAAGVWGGLLYAFWQPLIDGVRGTLDAWPATGYLYHAFDWVGFGSLRSMIGPFVVIILTIPLIVITVLLLIVAIAMPRVIRHLTTRQYATLEARRGGSWFGSLLHSLWTTLLCLVLLVVTLPLWFIPPFCVLVPPLLWGWLTYRVMTYDALALHASSDERRELVRRHRLPLLAIGVASGLLGSLPTAIWVASAWMLLFFPVIAALTIWIYAFILVFTALWFGHYCLRALQRLRTEEARHPGHEGRDVTIVH